MVIVAYVLETSVVANSVEVEELSQSRRASVVIKIIVSLLFKLACRIESGCWANCLAC